MTRTVAIFMALMALAACADPLDRVAKLSDVDLADGDQAPAAAAPALATPATEPEARAHMGGLMSRLLRPDSAAPEAAATETTSTENTTTENTAAPAPEAAPEPREADPAEAEAPRPLSGLFARRKAEPAPPDETAIEVAAPAGAKTVTSDAPTQAVAGLVAPEKRRRLFGPAQAADAPPKAAIDPNAPDARIVPAGTALPYGTVARVCDLPRNAMGPEVARHPDRAPLYRLHDSAPGSTAARAFYVTGFPDGCARQFTGALAMFGAARMHEQLRYGAPARSIPYTATDIAYEQIKAAICGVGRNTPCGPRVGALEKDTVFVTVYESFGGSARWQNLLLHDRKLVASDMNGG